MRCAAARASDLSGVDRLDASWEVGCGMFGSEVEDGACDFVAYLFVHFVEHLIRHGPVLDERVSLPDGLESDGLAHVFHAGEVSDPVTIEDAQQDAVLDHLEVFVAEEEFALGVDGVYVVVEFLFDFGLGFSDEVVFGCEDFEDGEVAADFALEALGVPDCGVAFEEISTALVRAVLM